MAEEQPPDHLPHRTTRLTEVQHAVTVPVETRSDSDAQRGGPQDDSSSSDVVRCRASGGTAPAWIN
jgi:hypothetical protein